MKKIISIITLIVAVFITTGCGGIKLSPAKQAMVDSKAELITQVSMWTEKNKIHGTNYAKGLLIPVNSRVILKEITDSTIVFEYNAQEITYLTTSKYTKVTSSQMLDRLFAKTSVDLSQYSKEVQESIINGETTLGMTKNEVLLSRGYPPFHETAGVESNRWKYWRHRFATANITFKNGIATKIKGDLY